MTRMRIDARRYFWWPSIDKQIEEVVRQCPNCTENSKQLIKVPLFLWPVTGSIMETNSFRSHGKIYGSIFPYYR